MSVHVVSAAQAAALEAAAIAAGRSSRQLMRAAGCAAAALAVERYPLEVERGVAIFVGPGNNGGDAWVVAGELARRGVRVRVAEAATARTPDALAERETASSMLQHATPDGTEGLLIDGLLGTGARGAPGGAIAAAIERIMVGRASTAPGVPSARVLSLDVPSGLDATSGRTPGAFVRADLTVTFGSLKRGLLVHRAAAGAIAVVEIGLGAADAADIAILMDVAGVRRTVPVIPADAHKGTRKRLLVVGGGAGMAGAPVLAARGALRSGIGMVKLCVARQSITAVQVMEPVATAEPWPESDAEIHQLLGWAHVLLLGPGLGTVPQALALAERLLAAWDGPVVLDADALRAFDDHAADLAPLLGHRTAILTPHAVEFARLAGVTVDEVNDRRFEIASELARTARATVLLKGVPTVISDGRRTLVSASGTPVLATAGSGDVLGGIAATLLAQCSDSPDGVVHAAASAAWIHGRAAALAAGNHVRGVVLDDVIASLRDAWRLDADADPPPVLAQLSAVGERR